MKDISQYIDFKNKQGSKPKRSIRSLLNLRCVILSWTFLESRYRDSNPTGRYVQMQVDVEENGAISQVVVNTGSEIIMEQLDKIQSAQQQANETDTSFSCTVKRAGRGVKLFPVNWDKEDVSA